MSSDEYVQRKRAGNVWGGKCPGEMSREFPGWEMSRGNVPWEMSWRNVQGISRVGNVLWEMSGVENVQRNVCREQCADTHADLEVSTCCSYD